MNDDIAAILGSLGEQERQSTLERILQGLQLSGMAQSFENDFSQGYGYGGRVGYSMPTDDGRFTAGLSGMGMKAETPMGTISDRRIMGGDLSYQTGPNTFSLSYDKMGMLPSQIVPQNEAFPEMPLQDLYRLLYRREF
jgi:hypothetical protein